MKWPIYTSDSPEAYSILNEGERLAQQALDTLKPREREVFVLRVLEQHSVEETAQILNIPPGTVKVRLHRAKKFLVSKLRRWPPPEEAPPVQIEDGFGNINSVLVI